MKIITIGCTDYKESDRIYNAVCEDKYLSFRVKGVSGPKSKFAWLNNPLTIADVEFVEDGRYKYPVLKDAKLISSPLSGNDSIHYLFSINSIVEVMRNMLQDEEKHLLFKDLEDALNALRNKRDCYMVLLIFMAHAMKLAGLELEVDHCVFCGTKHDIVTFSFQDGGFVCRHCYDSAMPKQLSSNQMVLVRYAFRAQNYSCRYAENYSDEDKKAVLMSFQNFISDTLGVKISTINFLIN